jgi:hypothetical protein
MDSKLMVIKLRAAAAEWPIKQMSGYQLRSIADYIEYLEMKIDRMTGNMHMKEEYPPKDVL